MQERHRHRLLPWSIRIGCTILFLLTLIGFKGVPTFAQDEPPPDPMAGEITTRTTPLIFSSPEETIVDFETAQGWILLSPAGDRMFVNQREINCVHTIEPAGLTVRESCFPMRSDFFSFDWDESGTRLLLSEDYLRAGFDADVWVVDIESGRSANLTPDGILRVTAESTQLDIAPQWMGDEVLFLRRNLADPADQGLLLKLDPRTGITTTLLESIDEPLSDFAVGPDGQSLAVLERSSSAEERLSIVDVESGEISFSVTNEQFDGQPLRTFRFSPDGETLLAITVDISQALPERRLHLLDLESGEIHSNLFAGSIEQLGWLPDGGIFLFGTRDERSGLYMIPDISVTDPLASENEPPEEVQVDEPLFVGPYLSLSARMFDIIEWNQRNLLPVLEEGSRWPILLQIDAPFLPQSPEPTSDARLWLSAWESVDLNRARYVVPSPDGKTLALYHRVGNDEICLLSVDDRRRSCIDGSETQPEMMRWSHDSKQLALVGTHGRTERLVILILDVEANLDEESDDDGQTLLSDPDLDLLAPAWGEEGQLFFLETDEESEVKRIGLWSGGEEQEREVAASLEELEEQPVLLFVLAGDDAFLVAAADQDEARLYRVDDEGSEAIFDFDRATNYTSIVMGPARERLMIAARDQPITLLDRDGEAERVSSDRPVLQAAWGHDGSYLLYLSDLSDDDRVQILTALPLNGGAELSLVPTRADGINITPNQRGELYIVTDVLGWARVRIGSDPSIEGEEQSDPVLERYLNADASFTIDYPIDWDAQGSRRNGGYQLILASDIDALSGDSPGRSAVFIVIEEHLEPTEELDPVELHQSALAESGLDLESSQDPVLEEAETYQLVAQRLSAMGDEDEPSLEMTATTVIYPDGWFFVVEGSTVPVTADDAEDLSQTLLSLNLGRPSPYHSEESVEIEEAPVPEGWTLYVDPGERYQIAHPPDWELLVQDDDDDSEMALLPPGIDMSNPPAPGQPFAIVFGQYREETIAMRDGQEEIERQFESQFPMNEWSGQLGRSRRSYQVLFPEIEGVLTMEAQVLTASGGTFFLSAGVLNPIYTELGPVIEQILASAQVLDPGPE